MTLLDWTLHKPSPLDAFAQRTESKANTSEDRRTHAAALLSALQPHSNLLSSLALAAAERPSFQISTQRNALAVFHPDTRYASALDRLHLVYQLRACASLELRKETEALDDVLTGLRLLNFSRQLPDSGAMLRSQAMLARSLQPLWEGLSQRIWSEPQIARVQTELQKFDLLSDYTNAVRRAVLAHIEIWRKIPEDPNAPLTLPVSNQGYLEPSGWELQPRAWWFENCLQLHSAGSQLISYVEPETGRIQLKTYISQLNGLPLDSVSRELFQQGWWWGTNPGSIRFVQTSLNQAILACALERFRLAHQAYPQTLDQLIPFSLTSIPRDPVTGRHIAYQRFSDTNFNLRGVGPNGTDDRRTKTSDDWLWAYSTNAATKASQKGLTK